MSLLLLLPTSCVSAGPATPALGGFDTDAPRVNQGLVLVADRPQSAEEFDRRLRQWDAAGTPAARLLAQGSPPTEPDAPQPDPPPAPISSGSSTPANDTALPPADAGRLIPLPRLSTTEVTDLIEGLRLRFQAELGYAALPLPTGIRLPEPPGGLKGLTTLVRKEGTSVRVVRFGIHQFRSQSPQCWAEGIQQSDGTVWETNPQIEKLPEFVASLTAAIADAKKDLGRDDLEFRLIQISYIDVEGALEALKGFGIETAETPSKVTFPVTFGRLPLVARMPTPDSAKTALLGADNQKGGAFDLSMTPSIATALPADPNLARSSQVLVYFHPAHPEQFSRVQTLLRDFIDRPARQIFIEGMVLEISEEGLKELGVEWSVQNEGLEVSLGNVFPGLPAPLGTLTAGYDSLQKLNEQWTVLLRALIEDRKAEVLSRPSVLTLNNRQATIRVGQEIPIATSTEAGIVKDVNRIAFSFKYLPTGISLNIRPRITEDGSEVSMLVDTVVSASIPGADLELRSSSGEVLAAAPTVATRRVQTYTRIGNNTPFIIGGLVNKEYTSIRRKVPLLGDIPYLGNLFRSKSTSSRKQEVIIVLTPHVLPEDKSAQAWGRYLPRDDDKFDDSGNVLFRDSYRIREQDVLDLSFLDRNERLHTYRRRVEDLVQSDFHLRSQPPFNQFLDGRTPGEEVLIERQVYEVLKRLSDTTPGWLDRRIALERVIFFSGRTAGGYDVKFVDHVLAQLGDGTTASTFFATNTGKALALTYRQRADSLESGNLTRNPIPEISLLDCPDRKTWGDLLWNLNQPDPDGTPRATILLHAPEDLVRLQRAVLLREVINLNGGPTQVTRKNFSLGHVLLVPDENPDETRLIGPRVAEYFFHTEHYYAATLARIQTALAEVDAFVASKP